MRDIWIGLAAAAMFQAQPTAPHMPSKAGEDSSEIVCEKVTVLGSRVATKRVCGTRAEWAERRKMDRETIEKAQMGANGPCQTINTHAGAPSC